MSSRNAVTPPWRAVMRDPMREAWRAYSEPRRVVAAHRLEDALPAIREVEAAVEGEGLHAAGFIAYEAAPAFDGCLPGGETNLPLLWFALFDEARELKRLPAPAGGPMPGPWTPSIGEPDYRAAIARIRDYIAAGDVYQINFTYRLEAAAPENPWDVFLKMAGDGSVPHAAYVDAGRHVLCSASPELFLRLQGGQLTSRPMKGTASRGLWYEDDCARGAALQASDKDRAENVMITDMVRNDLGRVARMGSVSVPDLFSVERFPTVWQMTSTVAAQTDAPLSGILRAAFPPASITGAPKRRAMEIIAELEHGPRGIYTGAIGWLAPGGRCELNVAIRTISIDRHGRRATYGTGGGVVWDSTADGEYRESLDKQKALRPPRRRFDLLESLLWTPDAGYVLLERHLTRLRRSAEYFGFSADSGEVRRTLEQAASQLAPRAHKIRLLVSRLGRVACEAEPLAPGYEFGALPLAAHPIDSLDPFLYHKTTARHVYEQALSARPGSSDVLLFNEAGELTESTRANMAFRADGRLWTPPISCGLLPGTQRAELLARGALGERALPIGEARRAEAIYLMNSVRGMSEVAIQWEPA